MKINLYILKAKYTETQCCRLVLFKLHYKTFYYTKLKNTLKLNPLNTIRYSFLKTTESKFLL